jgi:hypothetical protein
VGSFRSGPLDPRSDRLRRRLSDTAPGRSSEPNLGANSDWRSRVGSGRDGAPPRPAAGSLRGAQPQGATVTNNRLLAKRRKAPLSTGPRTADGRTRRRRTRGRTASPPPPWCRRAQRRSSLAGCSANSPAGRGRWSSARTCSCRDGSESEAVPNSDRHGCHADERAVTRSRRPCAESSVRCRAPGRGAEPTRSVPGPTPAFPVSEDASLRRHCNCWRSR